MGAALLTLSVPAEARYLKCIRGFIKPIFQARFSDAEVEPLVLAVDEACSNIVKHGQSWLKPRGRIELEVLDGRRRVELRILNFCREKDVDKIRPRDLDDVRPGGLGTHFMREVMDAVGFEPNGESDGRVALVMSKDTAGKKNHEADG